MPSENDNAIFTFFKRLLNDIPKKYQTYVIVE